MLTDEQQQVEPEELPAPMLNSLISGIRKGTFPGFLPGQSDQQEVVVHGCCCGCIGTRHDLLNFHLPVKEKTIVAGHPVQDEWETI